MAYQLDGTYTNEPRAPWEESLTLWFVNELGHGRLGEVPFDLGPADRVVGPGTFYGWFLQELFRPQAGHGKHSLFAALIHLWRVHHGKTLPRGRQQVPEPEDRSWWQDL